jgi:hypothetical protein
MQTFVRVIWPGSPTWLPFSSSGIPDELHTLGNISIIRAKEGEDLPLQEVELDNSSANSLPRYSSCQK